MSDLGAEVSEGSGPVSVGDDARRILAPLTDKRKIDLKDTSECRGCKMQSGPHRHLKCTICGEDRPLVKGEKGHVHQHAAHHDVYANLGWRRARRA